MTLTLICLLPHYEAKPNLLNSLLQNWNYAVDITRFGEVAEWLNVMVLKTVERCPRGFESSLSAIF